MSPKEDKNKINDLDLKRLGKRLNALRLKNQRGGRPVSLEEFARQSGVTRSSIRKIEEGRMKEGVSISTLHQWLKACGLTLRQFFGEPEPEDFRPLPFRYDPQFEAFFQLLATIVNADRPDLHFGIFVNLREIAEAARRHPGPLQNGSMNDWRAEMDSLRSRP